MTSPQQLEILDLRHFSSRQLRPLLEQEADIWQRRLRWNYESASELLLQYLDSRILPGFVALERGRICGFCFCVYEGNKAVIGDIFSAPGNPAPLAVTHTLARHLLEVLESSPDILRIEAQLLLYDSGLLPPAFAASKFGVYRRLFLEVELRGNHGVKTPNIPPELELSRWAAPFYQAAAELIHASYQGHIDSEINDQYRTLAGSLRFLHNVVRFPGCGVFDPESSWILRERRTNQIVALILCSRVATEVAHVTQLCVAPAFRGQRLGQLLLRLCMDRLPARNIRAMTLTVSEGNTEALGLYLAHGFRTRHTFDALVLDKPSAPRHSFALPHLLRR